MLSKSVTERARHPSAPSRGRLSWSQSRTLGNVSAPVTARRDGVKGADARSRWGPFGGLQGSLSSSRSPPQKLAPWFSSPKGLATIPSQSQGRMLQGRDHTNPNSKFGSSGGGSRVSIITGALQACRRYPVTSEPK